MPKKKKKQIVIACIAGNRFYLLKIRNINVVSGYVIKDGSLK